MSQYSGFNRAARVWENEVPGDSECVCDPVVHCPNCLEVYLLIPDTHKFCLNCLEDGEAFGLEVYEREDGETTFAEANCPLHGYCSGCSNPRCEDCAGGW